MASSQRRGRPWPGQSREAGHQRTIYSTAERRITCEIAKYEALDALNGVDDSGETQLDGVDDSGETRLEKLRDIRDPRGTTRHSLLHKEHHSLRGGSMRVQLL